ncbi:MAG: RsmB/NOP family class I SAM-dependent RNA methyltransferase [Candidatus Heimdallarchaeota archaeon]|nr:RsmB/NOP family class I SAM-dependent RNA methyltransferase [Candidatus Heimdallarchaeota archaeon]
MKDRTQLVNGSMNKAFVERWEKIYGVEQTKLIIKRLKGSDPKIITPNKLKISLIELKNRLMPRGFKFKALPQWNSLIVRYEPFSIVSSLEYLSGLFSIQALTSLIPPLVLAPKSNSVVGDLSAAPGIKTCLLAQEMENTGILIAIEKSKHRLSALKSNITRMGVLNSIILHYDSTRLSKLSLKFDHILLDAPCSGTGLKLSKDKRMSPKTIKDIGKHTRIQNTLLENAWMTLKDEGTLVYSVCSLEPEEGEIQVDKFLDQHPEAKILALPIEEGESREGLADIKPDLRNTRRFFPQPGYDGFFLALLQKG